MIHAAKIQLIRSRPSVISRPATMTVRIGTVAPSPSATARHKSTQQPKNNDKHHHFLETATDYFASLRWKAAETLTSILSQEERHDLWKKLDAVNHHHRLDDEESQAMVQQETQKTIGEAAIAARAEEAKRQEAKWEREKDKLMKEAEQAAMDRVENDLLIQQRRLAMERWQREVEREKKQQEESETNLVEVSEHSAAVKEEMDVHPVLGPVLVNFGYKRVHMVSAKTLSAIPVWKKQRIYRHDRAKTMAADKAKTPHLGLPGIIALHEDADGRLSILDGQHRVGMMTILQERKDQIGIDLEKILVEVFPQPAADESFSETHAQDIFTEVNKAEPVKLVDMPGVASKTDRKVITEGASRLQEQFPEMFKPSQQCRAPHLNIDNLRDALFASDVINKKGIKSPKALVDWMMEQNEVLGKKFQQEKHAAKVSEAALTKAVAHSFYLGLESSWLYS